MSEGPHEGLRKQMQSFSTKDDHSQTDHDALQLALGRVVKTSPFMRKSKKTHRDCGSGGGAGACFLAACLGCDLGRVPREQDVEQFREAFFEFLVMVATPDSHLHDGDLRLSERSAWFESEHLAPMSIFLGLPINCWKSDSTTRFDCLRSAAIECPAACCPQFQCNEGVQLMFTLLDKTTGLGVLSEGIMIGADAQRRDLKDEYVSQKREGISDFNLAINLIHKAEKFREGDTRHVGDHFTMRLLDGRPSLVHNPVKTMLRVEKAKGWVRDNGEYVVLLGEVLQLLYSSRYQHPRSGCADTPQNLMHALCAVVSANLWSPNRRLTLEQSRFCEYFKRLRDFWKLAENRKKVEAWFSSDKLPEHLRNEEAFRERYNCKLVCIIESSFGVKCCFSPGQQLRKAFTPFHKELDSFF